MDTLERLHNCSLKQLDEILSNDKYKSRDDIHSAYELIDIVKDVWCVWKYQEGEDDEYSEYGGMTETYPYRGRSYARGRGARRDSMGRYSREGSSYRGRGYYRDDAKQEYIEQLREMMEEAPEDHMRQKIQRIIREMEEN